MDKKKIQKNETKNSFIQVIEERERKRMLLDDSRSTLAIATFYIGVRDILPGAEECLYSEVCPASVVLYEKGADGVDLEIPSADEKITDLETISILFDYPLTNSVKLSFSQSGGFTRQAMYKAIFDGYTKIYAEEGPDPGCAEGTYCRAESYGPYGIWGRNIDELVIEKVLLIFENDSPGRWEEQPGIFALVMGLKLPRELAEGMEARSDDFVLSDVQAVGKVNQ